MLRLEKKRLKGNLVTIFKSVKDCYTEDVDQLFSVPSKHCFICSKGGLGSIVGKAF